MSALGRRLLVGDRFLPPSPLWYEQTGLCDRKSNTSRHLSDDLSVLQGAALGAMVGQMTYGKRQFENLDGVMRRLIPPFHQAMNELLLMVDADSSAFNSYMVSSTLRTPTPHTLPVILPLRFCVCLFLLQAALKMPKNTAEEIKR